MIKLIWDAGFKRSYKRRVARDPVLRERFWDALDLFEADPFAKELRTHRLTGNLSGCWSFSIDVDCRVVFMFLRGNRSVLLIDIGTHEEVY